jgi:hypothetical protein
MILKNPYERAFGNVIHGLASLCHEAGNGGNNRRRCPKDTRTLFLPPPTKLLVCLLHVFPLKMCMVVAIEVALKYYQFRVLVEGLPTGNSYAFLFNIT